MLCEGMFFHYQPGVCHHVSMWVHSGARWLLDSLPVFLWVPLVNEVGCTKPDTSAQDRTGAFMVADEERARQILLWLLWCGLVPFITCSLVGSSSALFSKETTGSTECSQQMWKQQLGNWSSRCRWMEGWNSGTDKDGKECNGLALICPYVLLFTADSLFPSTSPAVIPLS